MKKNISGIVIGVFFIGLVFLSTGLFADTPPDPGGDPNTGGGTPVGGSPVGSGLVILVSMGVAYGVKKIFHFKDEQ